MFISELLFGATLLTMEVKEKKLYRIPSIIPYFLDRSAKKLFRLKSKHEIVMYLNFEILITIYASKYEITYNYG